MPSRDPLYEISRQADRWLDQLDAMKAAVQAIKDAEAELSAVRSLMYGLGGAVEAEFEKRFAELFPDED